MDEMLVCINIVDMGSIFPFHENVGFVCFYQNWSLYFHCLFQVLFKILNVNTIVVCTQLRNVEIFNNRCIDFVAQSK